MRAFALLVAVLLFVPSAFAQDQAKPNTLTPKELADGWLLLFDGDTPFGWSLQSALGKPGFEAKDASLRLNTVKGQTMSVANSTPWNDFELECDFRCTSVGDARLVFAGLPKSFSLTFFATQPAEEWIHLRAVLTQAASGECKLASTYRTADGKEASFVRNGKADPAPCSNRPTWAAVTLPVPNRMAPAARQATPAGIDHLAP